MKTKILVALMVAASLTVACSKKETKAEGDKGGSSIPECDKYFEMVEKCAKNMPGTTGETMKKGMETTKKALNLATTPEAKKQQATACKTAADALAKNPACK